MTKRNFKAAFASLAAVALLASVPAHAVDVSAGAGVGGQVTVYGGSISGNGANIGTSQSTSAAEVIGTGGAYEHADNQIGSNLVIGGQINSGGVQSVVNSQTFSTSNVAGSNWGNTPTQVGNSIATGAQAFGNAQTSGAVTSQFAEGALGGEVAVQAEGFVHGLGF